MTAEPQHAGAATSRAEARTWLSVPEIAAEMAQFLRDGDDDDALRLLLDGVLRLRDLHSPDDLSRFLQAPAGTGDERWDALLAASVAHLCREAGHPAPRWTRRDSLAQWWWPGHVGARRAQVVQRTPFEFRRLGIWFDERNFTTA